MEILKVHITMSSYNVSIRKVYKCTSEGKSIATKRQIIACFSNSGKNRLDHNIFIDERLKKEIKSALIYHLLIKRWVGLQAQTTTTLK
jgi:hypothetical protein